MKRNHLFYILCLIIPSTSLLAQTNSIKVSSTGKVGINLASPTYQLDVAGDVRLTNNSKSICFTGLVLYPYTTGIDCGASGNRWARLYASQEWFTASPTIDSDESLKINILDLGQMTNKLKLLRPVSYQLNPKYRVIIKDNGQDLTQYGFIAQELKEIFPAMVSTGDDGFLGIRYSELIPVLVQVVKEQQAQIDTLNLRITVLEKSLKSNN